MTESACIEASDRDKDGVDPFRLIVDRRTEAEPACTDPKTARERTLTEAFSVIRRVTEKSANFTFPDDEYRYVREEAVSGASESLYQLCKKIYDGVVDPSIDNWKGFIATTVRNEGFDVLRRERRHGGSALGSAYVGSLDAPDSNGLPVEASIRADGSHSRSWAAGGVEDTALNRAGLDAMLRRLGRLRAEVESGEQVCAFHPGRRCAHVRTGRVSGTCQHLDAVFEAIGETIISAAPEPINKLLIGRTNYDGNRHGHQLRRRVYRCLDWFTYLLLRGFTGPFAENRYPLDKLERRVTDHLMGAGPDAPSATTLCILMNNYPYLPIPAQLIHEYGPIHLDRTGGESR